MHRCLLQPVQNEEPVRSLSTVGLRLSKVSGHLRGQARSGPTLGATPANRQEDGQRDEHGRGRIAYPRVDGRRDRGR